MGSEVNIFRLVMVHCVRFAISFHLASKSLLVTACVHL